MRAGPHLLQRLRRWLAVQGLDARARQLQSQIDQIEAGIADDHLLLARLRADLRVTLHRLSAARSAPRARRRTDRIATGD